MGSPIFHFPIISFSFRSFLFLCAFSGFLCSLSHFFTLPPSPHCLNITSVVSVEFFYAKLSQHAFVLAVVLYSDFHLRAENATLSSASSMTPSVSLRRRHSARGAARAGHRVRRVLRVRAHRDRRWCLTEPCTTGRSLKSPFFVVHLRYTHHVGSDGVIHGQQFVIIIHFDHSKIWKFGWSTNDLCTV